jgi:nucleoside-diphosphate-sugar epimerase
MHVLMLGGSGFLSGRLLSCLVDAGHKISCITRGERILPSLSGVTHIKADRNKDDLISLLAKEDYDIVADIICRNAEHAEQSIALAGQQRRLIMISTEYVYHPDHRCLPQNEKEAIYLEADTVGGNKRRAEVTIIKALEAGCVSAVILRPSHIYGTGSNPGTIPMHGRKPDLLEYMAAGNTLRLLQGGMGLIQPIHVDDMSRIILAMIEREDVGNMIFNTVGQELMTHADYYRELARCIGVDIRIEPCYPDPENVGIYVWGHRYYDRSLLESFLPDFKYTPFCDGVAEWVKGLSK